MPMNVKSFFCLLGLESEVKSKLFFLKLNTDWQMREKEVLWKDKAGG